MNIPVLYLLVAPLPTTDHDGVYGGHRYPAGTRLEAYLPGTRSPRTGRLVVNVREPGVYTFAPIFVRSEDLGGASVPVDPGVFGQVAASTGQELPPRPLPPPLPGPPGAPPPLPPVSSWVGAVVECLGFCVLYAAPSTSAPYVDWTSNSDGFRTPVSLRVVEQRIGEGRQGLGSQLWLRVRSARVLRGGRPVEGWIQASRVGRRQVPQAAQTGQLAYDPWAIEPRLLGFTGYVDPTVITAVAAPALYGDFYDAWTRMSRSLGADPLDMAKVAYAETAMNPRAFDPRSNAGGLIGFMPSILRGLGWTGSPEEFRQLTATQQVPYVERYYRPYAGYLRNEGLVYVANFLPSRLPRAAASDDSFVVSREGDPYYGSNRILDRNSDGSITVGDLKTHILMQDFGPRWNEITRELRARGAGGRGASQPSSTGARIARWLPVALLAGAAGGAVWYLYKTPEGRRLRTGAERRTDRGLAALAVKR